LNVGLQIHNFVVSHNNNNNNNNLDDIYSAVIYGASRESSLWFIWAKVGQRQVAANSQAKLQT